MLQQKFMLSLLAYYMFCNPHRPIYINSYHIHIHIRASDLCLMLDYVRVINFLLLLLLHIIINLNQ